jgi:hypothetical protein
MFTETSRRFDLARRLIVVTVTDAFGSSQDIQISVARDGCPLCGVPYMKTQAGVVDVEATIAGIATAQDTHTDNALASFAAAGADVQSLMAARNKS